MLIQGKWHAEGSAAQCGATLRSSNGFFTIETEQGGSFSGKLEDIQVSDRLGHVERKLRLEDGSVFVTGDNAAVDELFQQHKSFNGLVHAIESHMGWAAFALVATLFCAFAFFKWGVPWVSTGIAHALPHKTNELIGEGSLEFLDKYIFDESALDQNRREEIRAHFVSRLIPLEKNSGAINYRLHFRQWTSGEKGLPNAFALPSGDIILTDKFVELTENQDEIDAILLHEMGHVVHRHGLKMVVEGAIVTTVVMLATGDNSGLADLGLGIGSLLVSSNYSRGHESEADLYAFKQMLAAQIDPKAFSDIMHRMEAYMEGTDLGDGEKAREPREGDNSLMDYLSSHPNTAERIERAKQYSECFQQGLSRCEVN